MLQHISVFIVNKVGMYIYGKGVGQWVGYRARKLSESAIELWMLESIEISFLF